MSFTVTTADMTAALDNFGSAYKYPIYTAICNMTGFFASKRHQHFGYAAVSDSGCLLIADCNILGAENYYEIPFENIKEAKISRVPVLGTMLIKLIFIYEGKKMRFDLTASPTVVNTDLSEQGANLGELVMLLQSL